MGRKYAFTAKVMRQKRSLDMRFEKAIMTSRREFLSNALGTALVTAPTWPVRPEARSMQEQSDSTSKSRRTTQNISLRWDVLGAQHTCYHERFAPSRKTAAVAAYFV